MLTAMAPVFATTEQHHSLIMLRRSYVGCVLRCFGFIEMQRRLAATCFKINVNDYTPPHMIRFRLVEKRHGARKWPDSGHRHQTPLARNADYRININWRMIIAHYLS